MAQLQNRITSVEHPTDGHADDLTPLELRSAPADMGRHESPDTLSKESAETFEAFDPHPENDGLSVYFYQMGKFSLLTEEEEQNLFIKIEKCRQRIHERHQELAGYLPALDLENPPPSSSLNEMISLERFPPSTESYLLDVAHYIKFIQAEMHAAKNRVVEANLRLGICIAKKYRERGLDLPDLIQEANIGLINAIDHFDWRRGVRFGAYASWWIQQAIGYGIANHGRTIRLPAYLLDAIRKVNRAEAQFHQKGNYEPTREEIAEVSGLEVEKIAQLDYLAVDITSLEASISQETGGEMGDVIAGPQTDNPLTTITQQNLAEEIKAALTTLPQREQQIISLRYGLEDGKAYSLQEIGEILNLSRERIRQLEARALDRLRHPARSERLRDFLVA